MKNRIIVSSVIVLTSLEFLFFLPISIEWSSIFKAEASPTWLIITFHSVATLSFIVFIFIVKRVINNDILLASMMLCVGFLCFMILRQTVLLADPFYDIAVNEALGVILLITVWVCFSLGTIKHVKSKTTLRLSASIIIVSILDIYVYLNINHILANPQELYLKHLIVIFISSDNYIAPLDIVLAGLVVAYIIIVSKKVVFIEGNLKKPHRTIIKKKAPIANVDHSREPPGLGANCSQTINHNKLFIISTLLVLIISAGVFICLKRNNPVDTQQHAISTANAYTLDIYGQDYSKNKIDVYFSDGFQYITFKNPRTKYWIVSYQLNEGGELTVVINQHSGKVLSSGKYQN